MHGDKPKRAPGWKGNRWQGKKYRPAQEALDVMRRFYAETMLKRPDDAPDTADRRKPDSTEA